MALIRPVGATVTIAAGATAGTIAGDMSLSAIQAGMELIPGSRSRRACQGAVVTSYTLTGTTGATFVLAEPLKGYDGANAAFTSAPFVIETGGSAAALSFAKIGDAFLRLFGLQTTLDQDSKTINLDRVNSDATYSQVLFSRAGRLWGDLIQRTEAGIERLALRATPDGTNYVNALDIDLRDGSSDRRISEGVVNKSGTIADIGAARTGRVIIHGGGNITSLGSVPNKVRYVMVAAATTFVHNDTSLFLQAGANVAAEPGDVFLFASDVSGNWRLLSRERMNAAKALGDLGVTDFAKTLLDDTSGAAMWATMGVSQTLAQVGALNLPNGFQVRMGTAVVQTGAMGGAVITYGTPFSTATAVFIPVNGDYLSNPTAILSVIAANVTAAQSSIRFNKADGSPFSNTAMRVDYIAIGY